MNDLSENLLDEATHWLVRLQSCDFSEQDERLFCAWLESDTSHQKAYIAAEELWARLGSVEQLEVAEGNPGNLAANVFPMPKKQRWAYFPQAIAASFVLFAVAFASIMYFNNQPVPFETAIGEQREMQLDDGSRILLNTDSSVAIKYNESSRVVDLKRGEAFFVVAKNAARPFIVKTVGGLVRVIGTEFNVLSRSNAVEVTVLEGKVAVSPASHLQALEDPLYEPSLTLSANEQVLLDSRSSEFITTRADALSVSAWRSGELVYKGETLDQVLSDLNRYFDGEIKVGDPTIKDLQVVAIFQIQDKQSTIQVLEETFNLVSKQISSELTLVLPKK